MTIFLTATAFLACQKVELPTEGDVGDVPQGGVEVSVPSGVPDDALTVAEVQQAYPDVTTDDAVPGAVVGYVVGYVKNTMKNAVFSSDDAVESNILIADRRLERDAGRCMPVQLNKGSDVREHLNLSGHPEVLGMRVYLVGSISKYYGTVGMRNPQYYEWVEDGGEEPDEEVPDPEPEDVVLEVDGVNEAAGTEGE